MYTHKAHKYYYMNYIEIFILLILMLVSEHLLIRHCNTIIYMYIVQCTMYMYTVKFRAHISMWL